MATPSGERPIASLKVGDHVLAVDPKTGKTSTQTVQQVFVNHDTDLLNVTLRTTTNSAQRTTSPAVDPAYKQQMAAVASHGSYAPPSAAATTATASTASLQPGDETIHTTANHPWLSADRGWIVAGKLQLGEQVVRADGSTALVVALTTVRDSAPMWDLTVSNVHDFAVGDTQAVVHNCGDTATLRDGTQVSFKGKGWAHLTKHAAELLGKPRDALTEADKSAFQNQVKSLAVKSRKIFPWDSNGRATTAVLTRLGGRHFVIQFDAESGEVATAFLPKRRQLFRMFQRYRSTR